VLLAWVAAAAASAAGAVTLDAAIAAYEKRDLPTAYRQFQALARIGNGLAQYNLGVMLLNGEGVPRSVREGYYWLMCAADHGVADARPLLEQIGAQVKPEVTEKARGCVATAGREAALAMVPALPLLEDWKANVPARPVGTFESVFPDSARGRRLIGWVDTELTLGADGRVRDLWVLESFPEGFFEEAALDSLRAQKFEPAKVAGQAVEIVVPFRFRFGGYDGIGVRPVEGLEPLLQRFEGEAGQGKAGSQYVLYRLGDTFRELRDRIDWRTWGRKSFDAGFGPAIFRSGYCNVMGLGDCLASGRSEGRDDLRRIAVSGGSAAQLVLGRLALAERSEEGYQRAVRWLEAAQVDGDRWAARYLAVALLSSGDPARRDGPRALALVEPLLVDPLMKGDPSTWQIAAAAYAEVGRFADARAAQDRAIERARRYSWAPEELAARRKDYEEGRRAGGPPLQLAARRGALGGDRDRRIEACQESGATGTRVSDCRAP